MYKNYNLQSCQKVCGALVYLLDVGALVYLLDVFFIIRAANFTDKSYVFWWVLTVPLLLQICSTFCYERDFIKPLSPENQADIIEVFNSTSRYLDDLLNIGTIYFEQMVNRIYPAERQLNKANSSDTEAPFLDLNLPISNGTVSTKVYDKRDDF